MQAFGLGLWWVRRKGLGEQTVISKGIPGGMNSSSKGTKEVAKQNNERLWEAFRGSSGRVLNARQGVADSPGHALPRWVPWPPLLPEPPSRGGSSLRSRHSPGAGTEGW